MSKNFTEHVTSKTIKTFKSIVIEKRKTVVTSSDSKKILSEKLHRKAARVSAKITSSKKGTSKLIFYEPSKKVGQIQNTIFIQMNFNSQSILLTVTKHAEKNIRQSIGRIITEVLSGNFSVTNFYCYRTG